MCLSSVAFAVESDIRKYFRLMKKCLDFHPDSSRDQQAGLLNLEYLFFCVKDNFFLLLAIIQKLGRKTCSRCLNVEQVLGSFFAV